jgi:hypothetical protein
MAGKYVHTLYVHLLVVWSAMFYEVTRRNRCLVDLFQQTEIYIADTLLELVYDAYWVSYVHRKSCNSLQQWGTISRLYLRTFQCWGVRWRENSTKHVPAGQVQYCLLMPSMPYQLPEMLFFLVQLWVAGISVAAHVLVIACTYGSVLPPCMLYPYWQRVLEEQ